MFYGWASKGGFGFSHQRHTFNDQSEYTEGMPTKRRLSSADRSFLAVVADATFTNPFSDERKAIDRKITGAARNLTQIEHLRFLRETVSARLAKIGSQGRARLGDFAAEEQEVLRTAFLFEAYHRHFEDFDKHILAQLAAGQDPCRVDFAPAVLELLSGRGFDAEEANRFFSILFQVRRAYYFIHTALIGRSACMRELRRQLWDSVFTHDIRWYERYLMHRMEDFSTLLLGGTGTGKGTAAAAIGRSGFIPFDTRGQRFIESFTQAFVSINLSQYPETLIESELFGHKKGAFTGAASDHDGVLSLCSPHGAVFLDEIGEVSIPVQIKLLEVLQDRLFLPVGGREKLRFCGRVVAATNRSLDELRREGRFREDFFYRLCSQIITVPPLRQRIAEDPSELDDLLEHTLLRLTGDRDAELVARVREILERSVPDDYAWRGNVRELEQCVRGILLTRKCELADLKTASNAEDLLNDAVARGALSAQELVCMYCALLLERYGTLAEVARRTQLDRRTVKKHAVEGRRLLETQR